MTDRPLPEYDHRPGRDLTYEDLKPTTNRWRSHVYAQSTTYVPKEFVWKQVLRTEDYSQWLGLQLPPLPRTFSRGTKLAGRGTTAVVGEFSSEFSLELYYGERLLVIEVRRISSTGLSLAGPRDQKTRIRLCLDIFYPSSFARMISSTRKQKEEADTLLRRFVGHCQVAYMGES